MNYVIRHSFVALFLMIIFGLILSGCFSGVPEKDDLTGMASNINRMLAGAEGNIGELRDHVENLYSSGPKPYPGLFDESRYRVYRDGVFHTPEDDGHCEVWASGHVPFGEEQRSTVRMLEHACPVISEIYLKSDFYTAVYLTTKESLLFSVPFSNAKVYLKPKLDVTEAWVTFRSANPENNPGKRTIFTQPYLDAMGRGHMVSIIAPIYGKGEFEGTVALDITTESLVSRFLAHETRRFLIVTEKNNIVAMNKACSSLLGIKGPGKYRYLKKFAENFPLPEKFNLNSSPMAEIRTLGKGIASGKSDFVVDIHRKKQKVSLVAVPVPGWRLVELTEID